jgi:hypothetical protein
MNSLAGYDRLSRPIALEPGNFVVTAGLANCIAIAVYSRKIMAIAHFNTSQCHDGEHFDVKTILKWRDWLKAKTTGDTFAVGLGGIWFNTANKPPEKGKKNYHTWDDMRFDLICKVKQVFDYEPHVAAPCIRFGIEGNERTAEPRMEGSSTEDWMGSEGWRDEGTEIEYVSLHG